MSAGPNADRMPDEDELLVNELIMGSCNHPDYVLENERFSGRIYHVAVCTECAARANLYEPLTNGVETLAQLKRLIPRHFLDLIAARKILRHIESHRWLWSRQQRDSLFTYTFEKDGKKIEGDTCKSELSAIRSTLVRLAHSLPRGLVD